ncbi:hypothetical protein CVT26_008348 [Gymnopilus dilepis]|uniref:Beta-lactamase-related domain-containing protein n=1 Tax=Gymnopilus dilepis TaxID=231916 RepID=A0A409W9N1_9AGAR|nr:hypothetical protein CVT26_008348 [Gymnopilus dilepis]
MRFQGILSFLCSLSTAVLAAPQDQTVLSATTLPNWQYYYDADAGQHQANFSALSNAGYQPISLSAYGQPPNERYAAVWVQRPNTGFVGVHNTDGTGYQSFFNEWSQQGFTSTIISVTGPSSSAVYSGIMVKNGVMNWYQKCGLTNSQFYVELANAQSQRYILKSFTEFGDGTSADRRYCGVWWPNNQYDKSTYFVDESYSALQSTFNAELTKPYWRLSYLSISEDRLASSTFDDTYVGAWVAQIGMSAATLVSVTAEQQAAGRYPIHLQGGGTGSNTQFGAIWASQDIPSPRTWQVSGSVTGFKNNGQASTQADTLFQSWMQANGVRQAQFTVGKNGNTLLQKAYSWSETARHATAVNDVFLLASNSKMFVEATIQTLYNSNKLTPSTLVYPLLGYTNTPDPRLQQITVDQLLTHYGGLNDTQSGFDPTYSMRQIAIAQNLGPNPALTKDVVDFMSRYTLDYNPGAGYAYSNYGYLLLSYVVEHVTGMSYYDYLSSAVLQPGGYDVRQWPTSPSAHVNDPITQESMYTGLNAAQPQSSDLIADIFGGDGMYKEDCYGPAALAASATTLSKFIFTHAVWGIGGRVPGAARSGSTPGTRTWAESDFNGLDWAVTVNTRDFPPSAQDPFDVTLCSTNIPAFLSANPTS